MPNRFYRTLSALVGPSQRSDPFIPFQQWVSQFSYLGSTYPFQLNQSIVGNKENIPHSFPGYVQAMYKSNGAVFAVEMVRLMLFSEARFQYQRMKGGRPGDLWGDKSLNILENPWTGATTGDLLTRAIQDVDLAGNFYAVLHQGQIKRLQPDWVSILVGGDPADPNSDDIFPGDIDAVPIAYLYQPGGHGSGRPIQTLMPEDVVHFAPIPDPLASFRGMSWLTPIIREIMADSAATSHKLAFFENGATANMVVSLDPSIQKQAFDQWIKDFRMNHEGLANAYKTMYLGGGAKVNVVGADMQQMDFKTVQGAGETRIAAAGGVPPVIAGLSEGLESATYSNYGQARRRLADGTMRPLWRNFAGSLERIVPPPGGSRLWYDDRDIPFLREDRKDAADILYVKSQAINKLFMSGYDPESIIEAIEADDLTLLEHTGLPSVQLQPGQIAPLPTEAPPTALPAPAQGKLPAPAPTPVPAPAPQTAPNGKKVASAQILHSIFERDYTTNGHKEEPVVVHVHQAPVSMQPASVNVEPAQVTVTPQITVNGPARMVRETTFIKDEAGEIIGSRETEREAD